MIKLKVTTFSGLSNVEVEAVLSVDGDQFCVLAGENLQEGIAGFGRTPARAVEDFTKNFGTATVVNNNVEAKKES